MKVYIIKQIDTVLTVFTCKAKNKEEAEQKVLMCEAEEEEQGEVIDRVFEITEKP